MKYAPFLFTTLLAAQIAGCAHLAPTSEDRSASLTIVNLSDVSVCEVALAPRDHDAADEAAPDRAAPDRNRLPEGERIRPDESRVVYVRAGVYGVRLNDCRGGALYSRGGLHLVGAQRLEFRPVAVQRHPRFGTRRFAGDSAPPRF
jgi:hypothetical protein